MNGRRPSVQRRLRGQPLLVLLVLLAGWGMVRAATWVSPLPEEAMDAAIAATPRFAGEQELRGRQQPFGDSPAAPLAAPVEGATSGSASDPAAWHPAPLLPTPILPVEAPPISASAPPVQVSATQSAPRPVAPRLAAGHAMLMAAGFAQMRVPPEIVAYFSPATLPAPASAKLVQPPTVPAAPAAAFVSAAPDRQSRWSGDGWLMWRDDTTTPITSGRPSYGRSQLGAVVRYELAPGSSQRPQAYLRGSAALQGAREQEVAVGLSARPLARLPLRVAAELRASDRATGSELRPAAYVVTELAPQHLPGGLVAEGYAQVGYVGGRAATAFVDGQARVDRSLASAADFDLRAGAAAWGGAQREGARLDVGPSASLAFQVGQARARLAADYRVRVAGDAEPASGPALTLSAGF